MLTQVVSSKVKAQHRPHRNAWNDLRMRASAIEQGRTVKVPEYQTILAVEDLITHVITSMGCFSSDRQAVAFATSGRVLYDPIPLSTILESQKESPAGFLGFDLGEGQIRHLLGTHRLTFGSGRYQASREITIYTDAFEVEEPFVIDEISSPHPIVTGRLFR